MATETLRPNALGDSEQFSPWGETYCWQTVDEVVRDNGTTRARGLNYDLKDLYNIENSSGNGTINSITVYWWIVRYSDVRHRGYHGIKSGATEDWSSETTYTNDYVEYSRQFTTDPDTGSAWTWGAIDAVQVGQKTSSEANEGGSVVDQIYVVVDYGISQAVGGASMTIAGSLTMFSQFYRSMGSASMTIAGALVKLTYKAMGGASMTIAGTLGTVFTRIISVGGGAVSIVGALVNISEWLKLTLQNRSLALTLRAKLRTLSLYLKPRSWSLNLAGRSLSLSLQGRSLSLTLRKR